MVSSRADLQCLSQKLVVAAELFVSVGLWSFVDVPELFIFSRKDAAAPQRRFCCGSRSEPTAVTNPAVSAVGFPQIGSWPHSAMSAVLAACASYQRTRNAPWPVSPALLATPRLATVSRGGAAVERAVCSDFMVP